MPRMRNAAFLHRFAWATVLALLLGLRALGSVGYMPALDHGRVTMIICPGGEWAEPAASMPGMDHHNPAHQHQTCPYAEAGAIPLAAGSAPPLPVPLLVFVLLGAVALPSLVARSRVERPNQTGPPIPA